MLQKIEKVSAILCLCCFALTISYIPGDQLSEIEKIDNFCWIWIVQTPEMITISQTPRLLLNLMYYACVFSLVRAGGVGQLYLNHNFLCRQIAFAYFVTETGGQMYQL